MFQLHTQVPVFLIAWELYVSSTFHVRILSGYKSLVKVLVTACDTCSRILITHTLVRLGVYYSCFLYILFLLCSYCRWWMP